MVPSALLGASLSSDTYFFSVYVYTFTYCIGENRNKKKIETVTVTSLKALMFLTRKSYDQPTSGFKHLLKWHQVLHSKLMYFKTINELFYSSVVINGCQGISMNCKSE